MNEMLIRNYETKKNATSQDISLECHFKIVTFYVGYLS